QKGKDIRFELVFHHKIDGILQLATKENQIDINQLNEMLNENYEHLHEDMSLNVYNRIIKKNIIYSLVPITYNGDFISSLKLFLNRILGKRKKANKELISLHYFKNEAYYFATRQALEIHARRKHRFD